MQVKDVSFIVH